MWQEILAEVIRKTLSGFGERLADFGPNLLAMMVILAVGLLAAMTVRFLLKLLLPRVGFDRFAQRIGLSLVLGKAGITRTPSGVVAVSVAWAVFGVFLLLGIGALDLRIAMDLLSKAFAYLPQLLIALGILVLGTLVSGFVRRSVLIAAVNAGLAPARLLATVAQSGLLVLFIAMALEHLGLGRQVILTSFTILFGGVVLALALAFGLAGRDLARELLERLMHPSSDDDEGDGLHHL
ncbi:MAG: hypothetical protein JXO72_09830 [Vicinamibacteria bacterium]|nr:hypothetical protein [Vicinamibacteria bacterium]